MRRLLKIIGGLFLLLVLGAVTAFFFIDWIAKKGVERGGAYALGVDTKVKDLDVHPFAGKCSLESLRISNPPGFQSPLFMEMHTGDMAVDLRSLLSDTVTVPNLQIKGVDLILERAGGRSNFSVILENLRRLESGEKPRDGKEKKYRVGNVDIQDVRVKVDLAIPGQANSYDLQIPSIHLSNVGSDSDRGVLLSDLFAVVIRAILDEAAKKGAGRIPPEMLSELNQNLDRLKDKLRLPPDVLNQPGGLPGDVLRKGTDILRPGKEEKRP